MHLGLVKLPDQINDDWGCFIIVVVNNASLLRKFNLIILNGRKLCHLWNQLLIQMHYLVKFHTATIAIKLTRLVIYNLNQLKKTYVYFLMNSRLLTRMALYSCLPEYAQGYNTGLQLFELLIAFKRGDGGSDFDQGIQGRMDLDSNKIRQTRCL